jgi:WhiB family transcriptional regulator, redox-sensing transcriptional regulator
MLGAPEMIYDEDRMKRLPNVPPPRPYLGRAEVTPLIGENWRLFAACQSTNPELFFPVSNTSKSLEQVAEAKAICARCLVRRRCLAFALRTRQVHGIWGGLTEEERNQQTLARKADAASASFG